MNDVTRNLSRIESGDPPPTGVLRPLVHAALRQFAPARLAQQRTGAEATSDNTGSRCVRSFLGLSAGTKLKQPRPLLLHQREVIRRILVEAFRGNRWFNSPGGFQRVGLDKEWLAVEISFGDAPEWVGSRRPTSPAVVGTPVLRRAEHRGSNQACRDAVGDEPSCENRHSGSNPGVGLVHTRKPEAVRGAA